MNQNKKRKPKYGMAACTGFMIKKDHEYKAHVMLRISTQAALEVIMNLLGLFIAPIILKEVEQQVPFAALMQTILGFIAALTLTRILISYMQFNYQFGMLLVVHRLQDEMKEKYCTIAYPELEKQKVINIFSKAKEAVQRDISEPFWINLREVIGSVAGLIIYLMVLSTLDVWLMLLVVLTTVICYFAGKHINNWGYVHREEEASYLHKIQYLERKFQERATAKDIRIFGMKAWMEDIYRSAFQMYQDFQARKEKHYLIADFVEVVLTFLRSGAAYAYLIYMTIENGMSASEFLLYFTAISGFADWMNRIMKGLSAVHAKTIDISSYREYMDVEGEFTLDEGESIPEKEVTCAVELRNVTFAYPGTEKNILEGIHINIRPGEKIAVVGLNGAGKTTLVKLLCGFYNPTKGAVLLDGKDIRTYKRGEYYELFSAVYQQFSVMAATVAQNIAQTLENDEIDEAKVWDCIEKAGLKERILCLPNGIHTKMEKEVYQDAAEFSGGEVQRLMLARALYKEGKIVVLDEPTSALDPIAENDIYMKYNELMGGRTSIFISHRLASTRFCDRILFVADGKIAEEGTHEELLAKGGRYAELFEIQSRYYREGEEADE